MKTLQIYLIKDLWFQIHNVMLQRLLVEMGYIKLIEYKPKLIEYKPEYDSVKVAKEK